VVAVGFSNGANIAAHLLMTHPETLTGAVLLRPMLPYDPVPKRIAGKGVFIGGGRHDGIVPADQPERLAQTLEEHGAHVTLHWEDADHSLTESDIAVAAVWMHARFDA
jgi:predicted esterase